MAEEAIERLRKHTFLDPALIEAVGKPMTADEYLTLPETMLPFELLDGIVVNDPTPDDVHQSCVGAVIFCLSQLMTEGQIYLGPLDVRLDDKNVVQPNIFWIAPDGSAQVVEGRIKGAPDLVVEVVSTATARKDRGYKFDLYERHGVREYWLVEPEARFVEVYVLSEGRFARQGLYEQGDTFTSPVFGEQTINVSAFFEG